jgi:putative nucleotidyltransferase with HDIG domain
MVFKLNLREVTSALSISLDYVGIDDTMHGKRVAYLSYLMAKELQFTRDEITDIIYEGMLHDCGVSSTTVHQYLVSELDWNNSADHCIRGAKLLGSASFYKKFAPTIRYHHTHFDSFPEKLSEKTKTRANIIYLTDRVDALRAQKKSTDEIITIFQRHRNTLFKGELIDTLKSVISKYDISILGNIDELELFFDEWIAEGESEVVGYNEVREMALMFAHIVDAKSRFTTKHSFGVANLSKYLASVMGLDESSCQKVEIAGLLHDLGKLKVDDDILNKPSALNEEEREIMNHHSEDSAKILYKIRGFEEIADYTALHHETLDAKGYPLQKGENEIPLLARIIIVADIFQALVQDRPYREGLTADVALAILRDMEENRKIDGEVINFLEKHLEDAYKKALGTDLDQ